GIAEATRSREGRGYAVRDLGQLALFFRGALRQAGGAVTPPQIGSARSKNVRDLPPQAASIYCARGFGRTWGRDRKRWKKTGMPDASSFWTLAFSHNTRESEWNRTVPGCVKLAREGGHVLTLSAINRRGVRRSAVIACLAIAAAVPSGVVAFQ